MSAMEVLYLLYHVLLDNSEWIFGTYIPDIINTMNYYLLLLCYQAIGLMSRVFANGPGDQGSIPGQVIPKTQNMVFVAALLNTQHYKVRNKGKVEQSWEWSGALPNTSM